MLKMSFYDGTLDRKRAKEVILGSNKPCEYTFGYTWKNPTTHNKPISKKDAVKIIDDGGFLDITEEENRFHLNAFSENDMW